MVIALLSVTSLAGCIGIIEAPYTNGSIAVPFSITLTGDDPVSVRDVGLRDLALPPNASATATLQLPDVDSRLRVSSIGSVDPASPAVQHIGVFSHPDYKNDIAVEVANLPCYTKDCGPVRVIIELTDPRPDDRIAVNGQVQVRYGFPGSVTPTGALVDVTGLDDVIAGHRPTLVKGSDSGPAITLDADHPVALQPVEMRLEADDAPDTGTVVSESVVRSVDGVSYLVEPDKPEFQYNGLVQQILGTPTYSMAPFGSCDLGETSPCETGGILRLTWVGPDRVDAAYSVDTVVAGYGPSGLPAGTRASTTFGDVRVVPDDAPRLASKHDATLTVDRGSPAGRGTANFRLQLDHAPPAPKASIVEVPGIVVLTYSAVGRDGGAANGNPAQLRVNGSLQPYPPLIDVPLDGQSRTVGVPLFASCRPGASCTVDFFLELFPPFEGDDALPVTLTVGLEARLTSFASDPFPRDTAISIGPQP